MRNTHGEGIPALIREIEECVRERTHGRIRGLAVEEVGGQVVIRGRVPSHHTRQLALHAALQFLPGDRCNSCITVG